MLVLLALTASAFQSTLPARGATHVFRVIGNAERFQSTLPARGATQSASASSPSLRDFNPRSPHGERPDDVVREAMDYVISIHAPRTGSDSVTSDVFLL